MKHLSLFSLLVVFLSSVSVLAHGNKTHVMGTVTALDGDHMKIKTPEGKAVMMRLDEATTYRAIDGETTDARPQIGDRVVVDVTGPVGKFIATEVRFSPSNQTKPGHPAFLTKLKVTSVPPVVLPTSEAIRGTAICRQPTNALRERPLAHGMDGGLVDYRSRAAVGILWFLMSSSRRDGDAVQRPALPSIKSWTVTT